MSAYLYRVSRDSDEHIDYDEYDSYVVCAASPEEAVEIHPANRLGDPDRVSFIYVDEQWYMVFADGMII